MKSFNKVTVMGRVVRDPELLTTGENGDVNYTKLTLAVDRNYKNKNGEYDTDFIPVIVWNKLSETICRYVKKGSLIIVDGNLITNSYTDRDNIKRTSMEVNLNKFEFVDSKKKDEDKEVKKIS